MLDVWPALLDIAVSAFSCGWPLRDGEEDNLTAALEHRDRVQRIFLWCVLTPRLVSAMQEPFPELKDLEIITGPGTEQPAILLDSFLGGSAPRLQTLRLQDVRGPALQRLLLSAHNLTKIHITVPQDSVLSVSPEAMVTCLSTMTKLGDLNLDLPSIRSGLDPLGASGCRPPQTRTVLPSLTVFAFEGNNEYLGDFVARIDAPLLEDIKIIFDLLHFDTLQLLLFIDRTGRFKQLVQARLTVFDDRIELTAFPHTMSSGCHILVLETTCTRGDLDDDHDAQLSSLVRICAHSFPPFSTLERLAIAGDTDWEGPIPEGQLEDLPWLEFLRPFTSVKDLYLCKEIALRVVPVLCELAEEGVTEVLPVLQNIVLVGNQPLGVAGELVAALVAARQLSGHILTIGQVDGIRKTSKR
ncbi:hypothetical protein BC826DRAFT_1104886 [Russula brevipes]|nr:hypothetical protein BC826DRAFT_1104886 [Russula brevipes]